MNSPRGWRAVNHAAAFHKLVLGQPGPVVVAFESGDCPPCRLQRRMLDTAWTQLDFVPTRVIVDMQRFPEIADQYRIVGYPTAALFADGVLVGRFPGLRGAAAIADLVAHHLRTD